jgi:Collagen triple helix repeat (20 copies)
MRKRLSYANVTATLALVFAMSGGALAANSYLITSTKQISPKVLTKLKGKTGRSGSTGATGPAGPQGATGPAGSKGESGAKGETGTVDTSNFYDKSETEERFAKGNATLRATRTKTALNPPSPVDLFEIPGVASVVELNCQSSGANAEVGNLSKGSTTDIWVSRLNNPPLYVETNWVSVNTPFEKTAETTFHVGSGTGSTSHIYTVNVTTVATGSECIFGVTAVAQ